MGWRAIRIGLDRPAMLRGQLRALIQGANGRSLSIMFPMIAEVGELLGARNLLDLEMERASAADRHFPSGCVLALCSRCRRSPGSSTACYLMSISFRLVQTTFFSSSMQPIAETAAWRVAQTVCPQPMLRLYTLWSRRRGPPASTSRCVARWRAVRSKLSRCSPSACARSRCRRDPSDP